MNINLLVSIIASIFFGGYILSRKFLGTPTPYSTHSAEDSDSDLSGKNVYDALVSLVLNDEEKGGTPVLEFRSFAENVVIENPLVGGTATLYATMALPFLMETLAKDPKTAEAFVKYLFNGDRSALDHNLLTNMEARKTVISDVADYLILESLMEDPKLQALMRRDRIKRAIRLKRRPPQPIALAGEITVPGEEMRQRWTKFLQELKTSASAHSDRLCEYLEDAEKRLRESGQLLDQLEQSKRVNTNIQRLWPSLN